MFFDPFETAAILIVLATLLGFFNYRFIGLPHTIGLTVMGALASLAVIGIDWLLPTSQLFIRGTYPMLVWGGLRGGISIALVLSIPDGEVQALLLTVTYVVVVFSVAIQGTTVGIAADRLVGDRQALESA